MTRDGDPRQQARLGLFLTVSLLLHAVAVPFMQTGTTSDGHSGDGLQVTLVGAARENPAGATTSDRASARSDDAPTRQRTTQRRREPQVEATTTVAPPAEPTTPTRVQHRKPETSVPPAALSARTEPARSHDEPTPGPATTARVENPEPETGAQPATVVARTEPASSPAEPITTARVKDPEPDASTPPTTVVARTEPAPTRAEPPPEPTTTARVETPEPETIGPPTREQSQTAASDSEAPEPTPSPASATTITAAAPGTLARAASSSASSPDAGGERTLLALLHHAIDNRKRYPRLARRQRREGSATVLFRLHPDGALDRLELAASSGFDLLDRAALRAVADVAPFAPAMRYLTRDKQFSVEVEFRLF